MFSRRRVGYLRVGKWVKRMIGLGVGELCAKDTGVAGHNSLFLCSYEVVALVFGLGY